MKIAALYCVSGGCRWLPYSYKAIYPLVDAIYFFVSSNTWYGGKSDNGVLLEQLSKLADPDKKARLESGDWSTEIDQRNASLAFAQVDGFTHGLIIDADEIYDTRQLKNGLDWASSKPDTGCFHIKWFTYWKNLEWRIDPIEPYDPPILVKLGAGGFVETRNVLTGLHELIPPEITVCHHLSYVLTEEELARKHISQPGHSQSHRTDWYENVWKKWDQDNSLENLHPVKAEDFKRAVRQPWELLPEVLRV